jgi:hypothetical protein
MRKRFNNVFSWVLCIYFLITFLLLIPEGLTSLFYLGLSILLFPPLFAFLESKRKKSMNSIRLCLGIALLLIQAWIGMNS